MNLKLDSDNNFFKDISSLYTKNFLQSEAKNCLENFKRKTSAVLHINIRSLKKSFNNLKIFSEMVKIKFIAPRISTKWCGTLDVLSDSNYVIDRYKAILHIRDKGKGGGILNLLHLGYGQISNTRCILRCST